jgi:hypothetical protein
VYLDVEAVMVTTDPLLDVKVHSIEDTAGEADMVQGITTLLPVIAV